MTDGDNLAIVNVTIKNTGDDSFEPKRQAMLVGEMTSESPEDDFFTEREEDLQPGDEITGDLVFFTDTLLDEDVLYLTQEIRSNEETEFELPVPEE